LCLNPTARSRTSDVEWRTFTCRSAASLAARCKTERLVIPCAALPSRSIDRIHYERGPHRGCRAMADVSAHDLERDRPLRDMARALRRYILPECAHLKFNPAEHREQFGYVGFVHKGLDRARMQLALRETTRQVADHALLFGPLGFEIERVFSIEPDCVPHRNSPEESNRKAVLRAILSENVPLKKTECGLVEAHGLSLTSAVFCLPMSSRCPRSNQREGEFYKCKQKIIAVGELVCEMQRSLT